MRTPRKILCVVAAAALTHALSCQAKTVEFSTSANSYPTDAGTRVIVSLPKMSITLTATM